MVHGHAPQRLLLHEDGHVGHAGAHAFRQVGGKGLPGHDPRPPLPHRLGHGVWGGGHGQTDPASPLGPVEVLAPVGQVPHERPLPHQGHRDPVEAQALPQDPREDGHHRVGLQGPGELPGRGAHVGQALRVLGKPPERRVPLLEQGAVLEGQGGELGEEGQKGLQAGGHPFQGKHPQGAEPGAGGADEGPGLSRGPGTLPATPFGVGPAEGLLLPHHGKEPLLSPPKGPLGEEGLLHRTFGVEGQGHGGDGVTAPPPRGHLPHELPHLGAVEEEGRPLHPFLRGHLQEVAEDLGGLEVPEEGPLETGEHGRFRARGHLRPMVA